MAARVGRRQGLDGDDVSNTALLALVAGLIVARLWNAAQFWFVYADEPLLLFRPAAERLRARARPRRRAGGGLRLALAAAVGPAARAGRAVRGRARRGRRAGPRRPPHRRARRHADHVADWAKIISANRAIPSASIRAAGLGLATILLWWQASRLSTGRLLWGALLAYALVRLAADGFVDVALSEALLVGSLRLSQVSRWGWRWWRVWGWVGMRRGVSRQ